jgi:hypothetical protein
MTVHKRHLSVQAGVLDRLKPSMLRCHACGFKLAAALA